MPSHPERVRSAPLSKGYQFGDAAHVHLYGWRSGLCRCGARMLGSAPLSQWNVIEGERHGAGYDGDFYGPSVESTPITSDYATDYSQRSPYVTDRDPGDETPTRRLRRREA